MSDQLELDTRPGLMQISHQGEVFGIRDWKVCPSQILCTGTTRRTLTLHPGEQMQALFAARGREHRGMEATPIAIVPALKGHIRRRVRAMGLRRSRSIGLR